MTYYERNKRIVKQIFFDARGNKHMIIHYKDINNSYFNGSNLSYEPEDLDFALSLSNAINEVNKSNFLLFKCLKSFTVINHKSKDEECILIGVDGCNEDEFNIANNIINEACEKANIFYKDLDRTNEDINVLLHEQFETEYKREADELYFKLYK